MEFRHEIVMPNEDLDFRMFIFEGKDGNYAVDKHWHRSVEIFAVFEGEIKFFINSEAHVLQAGSFMIVNSNEIHSIKAPNPNITIVLQIPLSVFEKYYTDDRFIQFTHSSRAQDVKVTELVQRMYGVYHARKLGYELQVKSQFYQLIYLLVSKYRETEVSQDQIRYHKKLTRLSTITSYIRDNYTKELSLEGLAEIFGYSPAYLSRMFQKYAMTNYKTYLQNVRVEYGYQELANTENSISEIALNNGFPNSKAFSKTFQKKYGVLPSIYRKTIKGQKSAID